MTRSANSMTHSQPHTENKTRGSVNTFGELSRPKWKLLSEEPGARRDNQDGENPVDNTGPVLERFFQIVRLKCEAVDEKHKAVVHCLDRPYIPDLWNGEITSRFFNITQTSTACGK